MSATGVMLTILTTCMIVFAIWVIRELFFKKIKGFSQHELEVAAQACINSYNGRHGEKDNDLFVFTETHYDDLPHFYIAYHRLLNTVFLVFQGTTNSKGWENNFDYQQIQPDEKSIKGYVHKGFYRDEIGHRLADIVRALEEAHQKAMAILVREGFRIVKPSLVITGHSKGASDALLFALKLGKERLDFNSVKVVALAPARVTSPRAAKAYRKKGIPSVIFQYGNDTVTRVPFRVTPGLIKRRCKFLWMNFWPTLQLWRHPAKVIHLGRPWYIWLMHRIPIIRYIGNPLDHRPKLYLEGIKKLKN